LQESRAHFPLIIRITPAKAGKEVGGVGGSHFVSCVILQRKRENLPIPKGKRESPGS